MSSNHTRIKLLRSVLRSLNGTINTLSKLDRDPPIIELAQKEMNGEFASADLSDMERDLFELLNRVNNYRSRYWKLQRIITQSFIKYMNNIGFLPSTSPEINSLKNGLPEALIKGDTRMWIYSYNQYIGAISNRVGRHKEDAPEGKRVIESIIKEHRNRIQAIEDLSNSILPDLFLMKAKVRSLLHSPSERWKDLHVKRPKVDKIHRPVKKVWIIKHPLPLPKKPKMPRKKILKKPDVQIVGPEET